MALMFRSVLQSGGGAELVVTCDSEFAGATISCSDGTTTLNKTCPVSSPYEVTFKIPNSGDWTVSATVSGTTYSSDPISVDLDYETDLEFGFNWRRWVDTAQYLDSTDYSTLSDLLADEEAVRELCLEHACVDYLCDGATVTADLATVISDNYFAKWANNSDYALDNMIANAAIKTAMDTAGKYELGEWVIIDDTTTPPTWGAKGNVPIMTSNTSPYGEAINYNCPSSLASTAYKAFDGSSSTYSETGQASGSPAFGVGYRFTNPVCVKKVYYHSRPNMQTQTAYVQASNDGNTWTDLAEFTLTADSDHNISTPNNTTYYLYHRIIGTHYNSGGAKELQFYGRELSVSVPTMTSNTAPYGEASASSVAYDLPAWKAFDGNNSSYWVGSTGENQRLAYHFTMPTKIKMAVFLAEYNATFGVGAKNCKYQYSDDGTNWNDVSNSAFVYPNQDGYVELSELDDCGAHEYWSIYITDTYATQKQTSAKVLQFYGKDYSEKEFEEGSTKKWLYDHGLELETLDFGTAVKGDSYVYFNHINSVLTDEIDSHSKIDLTPYSNVRIKTAGRNVWAAVSSVYGFIAVSNAKNVPYTQWSGYVDITPTLIPSYAPNNISYDISSFNEEKYISIGSTDTTGRKWDISEWWLE